MPSNFVKRFMNQENSHQKRLLDLTRKLAEDTGLYFFGVASLDVEKDYLSYEKWIEEGRHGSMEWMQKNLEIRKNPQKLLPGAKTALVFGFNYFLGDKWLRGEIGKQPMIAQYARLKDYHKFLRNKLTHIQFELIKEFGDQQVWRITVDSAPLLERALAANTGDAFIGKNTCMIHPKYGSFFLLGEILTSWDFDSFAQPQVQMHHEHRARSTNGGCGTCRRCQVHCPTGALDQDYRIDARRCLSYWTIEHKGEIPLEFWPWIGRYLFGCDICQLVCPYNRGISVSEPAKELIKVQNISYHDLVNMDQRMYENLFAGTPMTRAKRAGLRRNALIAAVVLRDDAILSQLDELQKDEDPIIQSTALQAKQFLKNTKSI